MTRLKLWSYVLILSTGAMLTGVAGANDIDFVVVANKVLVRPGEKQIVRAICSNQTDQAISGLVKMKISYNLVEQVELESKSVELQGKERKEVVFSWMPTAKFWGCTAEGNLLEKHEQGNTLVATSRYVFAVSDNAVEASPGLGSAHTLGNMKPEAVRDWVQQFADGGLPLVELYAWQPSCWGKVVPDTPTWVTSKGEGGYGESAEKILLFNDTAHAKGMKVLSYAQMSFRGPVGVAWCREHPEDMLYGSNSADKRQAELNPKDEERFFKCVNPLRESAMNTGLDQYALAMQKFHFDGLRWDGHPGLWYQPSEAWIYLAGGGNRGWPFDYEGKPLLPANPDETNLAILRHMRQRVDSQAPGLIWGFNISINGRQGGTDGCFPRTFRELATGNLILHEAHFGAGKDGTPAVWKRQKWSSVRNNCIADADQARALGGYSYLGSLSSQCNVAFMHHVLATHFAAGNHVGYVNPQFMVEWNAGKGWGYYPGDYMRFALRFNKFLFHPALWRFDNTIPFARVSVTSNTPFPVIYKDFLYDLFANGRYHTIVHVINPLITDNVNIYRAVEPSWMVTDAVVSLAHPLSLEQDKARYFALSPEWPEMIRELKPVSTAGNRINLQLPPFRYWAVMVAQYDFAVDRGVTTDKDQNFLPGLPF